MRASNKKKARRLRRRRHIRKKLSGTASRPRLTVFRSAKHIYCQVIDDLEGVTLVSASSLVKGDKDIVSKNSGNVEGATAVGEMLASRLKEKGISLVAFDRNGYRYHGRVQAVAEALRKEGIGV